MTPADLTTTQRETVALFPDGTPLTTAEVAEGLGVGRRSAYERLERLVDRGYLATKKVGASGRVWWRQDGPNAAGAEGDSAADEAGPADARASERERTLERYARIIDAVGEPVYELDAAGRITFVNEPFLAYSGYTEAELLGNHPSMGMDERDVERTTEKILDLIAAGGEGTATLEYDVVTKSGVRLPAENRLVLLLDDDGTVRGSAGVLWDVSERVERERELERQRGRLAALNDLHALVSAITHGVIDRETRDGVQTAVCERAVAAEPYRAAWIAEFDAAADDLRVTTRADGPGSDPEASPAPDDVAVAALANRAVETGQVLTSRIESCAPDPSGGGDGEAGDVRAVVAIPIGYGETTDGVLILVADRETASDEDARAVIGGLGEVIGHALAAVDRKRALMGDVLVELQFRVADFFDSLGVDDPQTEPLTLDHVVPIGDDRYLAHGRTTEAGVDELRALVAVQPDWEDLQVRGSGERVRFSFTLGETPVLSTLAAVGGRLKGAVAADGEVRLTVHLTPETDARRLIDAVAAAFPGSELVTHRQIVGSEDRVDWREEGLPADLTERQRTVLEVATHAGYFEWPRAASGTDVAGRLGIAPPTFHQHLRAGERKVFESLVGRRPADGALGR